MHKFAAIKIHSDSRLCPDEQKLAYVASASIHQEFVRRYETEKKGGWGFHECMNFEIPEEGPTRAYLPPTARPSDFTSDFIIFSFSYSTDLTTPSSVLGVHGRAKIVSKDGIPRIGIPKLDGVDEFTYNLEADPDFVTLFSRPIPYNKQDGLYTKKLARWGFGLRYIERGHASKIIQDALSHAFADARNGSKSYQLFVERGISVLERIQDTYGLTKVKEKSFRTSYQPLPDRMLGREGERVVYEREIKYVQEAGLSEKLVSWTAQFDPGSPFDIMTVRQRGSEYVEHYLEIKSTTLKDLSNIYVSQRQIDYMSQNSDHTSLIVLVFDSHMKVISEYQYTLDELRAKFKFEPIKFRLKPQATTPLTCAERDAYFKTCLSILPSP